MIRQSTGFRIPVFASAFVGAGHLGTVILGIGFWLGAGSAVKSDTLTISPLSEFGEWAVACDNTGDCGLINASKVAEARLSNPDPFWLAPSRICVHRPSGAEARAQFHITFIGLPPLPGAYLPSEVRKVRPDHSDAMSTRRSHPLQWTNRSSYRLPHVEADRFFAAVRDAKQLSILNGSDVVIGSLPVVGLDAALAHVDTMQGRAGGITALRDKGDGQVDKITVRLPAPSIVTASLGKAEIPPRLSSATLRLHASQCTASHGISTSYRVIGDRTTKDGFLLQLPCSKASVASSTLWIMQYEDGSSHLAPMDKILADPIDDRMHTTSMSFNHTTGILREQYQGNGGAYCGVSRTWGWTGRGFKLVEERRLISCVASSSGPWLRVWRTTLATPADGPAIAQSGTEPPC